MNAARELTSAISMLRAPTPKVDITVLATRDLLEMDLTASVSGIHFFQLSPILIQFGLQT